VDCQRCDKFGTGKRFDIRRAIFPVGIELRVSGLTEAENPLMMMKLVFEPGALPRRKLARRK
jgi:hypothetical protein